MNCPNCGKKLKEWIASNGKENYIDIQPCYCDYENQKNGENKNV